ncbi:MAG: GIN domain-containing protein [Litorimonas sp.]
MTQTFKKRAIVLAALMTSAMVVPASATDITIENFVGKVTVVAGNDGVEVVRQGEERADYRDGRDQIFIDGGLSNKDRNEACNGSGMSWNLDFGGRRSEGNTRLEDYPELIISVPNGSNLTIRDSALALDSQVDLGDADFDVGGCFDLKIASADKLTLDKSGSGEIEIGTVGTLNINKSGSGDVEVERANSFELDQSGSGDVDVDRVDGPVTIEKSGSGDIEIGQVDGNFSIEKSGSGDVEVNGGTIPELSVRNSGSGDVDINAAVGDAYVRASGASDVYVKSISGSLDESTSGSSDFTRGDD